MDKKENMRQEEHKNVRNIQGGANPLMTRACQKKMITII